MDRDQLKAVGRAQLQAMLPDTLRSLTAASAVMLGPDEMTGAPKRLTTLVCAMFSVLHPVLGEIGFVDFVRAVFHGGLMLLQITTRS